MPLTSYIANKISICKNTPSFSYTFRQVYQNYDIRRNNLLESDFTILHDFVVKMKYIMQKQILTTCEFILKYPNFSQQARTRANALPRVREHIRTTGVKAIVNWKKSPPKYN